MYPTPTTLSPPLEPYAVTGYRFRQRLRRRIILWATHLGDDVVAEAGTPVQAIGEGEVVWAEVRPGSAKKRNWGGLVVLAHTDKRNDQSFFSLYGHLTNLKVQVGDSLTARQPIGDIAPGLSPENGWWKTPHLHFAIYTGPWTAQILPGYKRPEERRTKVRWWRDPQTFISEYNK